MSPDSGTISELILSACELVERHAAGVVGDADADEAAVLEVLLADAALDADPPACDDARQVAGELRAVLAGWRRQVGALSA